MGMMNFSNHVIAVAEEFRGGITNLELQKVMYFAIGKYIADNGIDHLITEIYDERFEAWPYGPVVRSVYFEHKLNGNRRIRTEAEKQPEYEVLNEYITEYLNVPVRELVEKSHEHSIWRNNVIRIMQRDIIEYSLGDIQDAFNE